MLWCLVATSFVTSVTQNLIVFFDKRCISRSGHGDQNITVSPRSLRLSQKVGWPQKKKSTNQNKFASQKLLLSSRVDVQSCRCDGDVLIYLREVYVHKRARAHLQPRDPRAHPLCAKIRGDATLSSSSLCVRALVELYEYIETKKFDLKVIYFFWARVTLALLDEYKRIWEVWHVRLSLNFEL